MFLVLSKVLLGHRVFNPPNHRNQKDIDQDKRTIKEQKQADEAKQTNRKRRGRSDNKRSGNTNEKHKNKYSAKEQHGNNKGKNDDGNMQMREGPGARKKELEVKSCSFFFRTNPSHANLARTRGNNIGNKRHGDKEAKQFRSSETHTNTGVYAEKTLLLPRSDEKKPVPDTHKQTTFPSNDQ